MTCHEIYIVNQISLSERIYYTNQIMENIHQLLPLQTTTQKKESMLLKRLKAKQKASASPVIKIQSKIDVRKERNRCAAQKSRDKKKQYLQHLQQQNMRLKDIISRCEICSAENELYCDQNHNSLMQKQQEQMIPITQTPPTFANEPDRFIREDQSNEDSSSHVSKYFWFACLVVLICMTNLPIEDSNHGHRQLFQAGLASIQNPTIKSYLEPKNESIRYVGPLSSNKTRNSALMTKQEINYCQKCLECLRNITNQTNGQLILLSNQTNQNISQNSTTSKVLFCKSKAKFFQKIYEALKNPSQRQLKNSRQITKMLVKGKALNELMQEDCFNGQELIQDQQYLISFTLAILEMAPVKMSRSGRLSMHSD